MSSRRREVVDDAAVERLLNRAAALQKRQRFSEAQAIFQRLQKRFPNHVRVLHPLALSYAQTGELGAALDVYEKLLMLNPADVLALCSSGVLLARAGRREEALVRISKAISIKPDSADVLFNCGSVLSECNRHAEALACFERIVAMMPGNVSALMNRGYCHGMLNRHEAALESYDKVLRIVPRHSAALFSRGVVLNRLRRFDEALGDLNAALTTGSNLAQLYYERGVALGSLKRYGEALKSLDRALKLQPHHTDALKDRGIALFELGRYKEALADFDRVLRDVPEHLGALCARGAALGALGQDENALRSYARALAIDPAHAHANWNESLIRLTRGEFAAGWEKYKWRWNTIQRWPERYPSLPLWTGDFVKSTMVVWSEQGLGDQILYASMLDDLRSQAERLVVEVEPRLVALFARSFPRIDIEPRCETGYRGDASAHIPMGSIGQFLRRSWQDFPTSREFYLTADRDRRDRLKQRLAVPGHMLVGISWLSREAPYAVHKSVRLADMGPILQLPGMSFIDVQYGDTAAERRAVLESTGANVRHVHEVDNLNGIDDLAALISACDAVVTISNTTAHLAGALGTTCFVLLPFARGTHWYWHTGRDDNPWYPSARLFRQPAEGNWEGAIYQVATALARIRDAICFRP